MNRMVADVMATPVVSVQPGTSFKGMIQLLTRHQISALPVVDPDGHVLGIVSETDLVRKEERPPPHPTPFFAGFAKRGRPAKAVRGTTAADFMSTPAITIPPGASLGSAARLLHERNVRHLPVVDHDGRLVGIIARRDLLSVFLQTEGDIRHEITAAVLRATFNLPADAVEVEVREGVVALSGRVPWRSSAREIVDRVSALDGVVDVVDRLSWAHDDTVNAARSGHR
ncbi:MAG TPA: CBS domain-containing protein [Actinomycetes bacterium]|jgi:CBS domain-containing protein|nr:CBS domain-containing protein [Actinomycetes bacterium]